MNTRSSALVLVLCVSSLFGVAQEPIRHPMVASEAENYLASLIPAGKKHEVIRLFVFGAKVETTNVKSHCSSTGRVQGSADENGNFTGSTNSSSDCYKTAIRHRTLFLALPLPEKDNHAVLVAHCAEKWIWNHCDNPPTNTEYPFVIEKEKHGFNLYVAAARRVGGDPKVARYEILQVDRVVLPKKASSTPAAPSENPL